MEKAKKIKKTIYALTGASAAYGLTNSILKYKSNNVAQIKDKSGENEKGYEELNLLNNVVHTNNFVIFHIKDNQNIAILEEKIKFCKENDISVGLVLDTEASKLSEIYEEIDLLQAIVKEYPIDFPVYCNIDHIMNNDVLNNVQKAEIIQAFTDKLSRSDMYIGLYGTDSNLYDCNKYVFNTDLYDCFVVQDDKEMKFNGNSSIKKDLDGNIIASYDISKVILEKKLNSSKKLVASAIYKAKENDSYHSLALKFGLSEKDLRKYNDDIKGELSVGQSVKIPNLYTTIDKETNNVSYNYAIARGIDISSYQEYIEWDRVAETSDFVIVQVAREPVDYANEKGEFKQVCIPQIKNVVDKDIVLGLYFCITKDMKVSVYEERLKSYFETFEKQLKENNITLKRENIPVFLDFEEYYEYNDYYKLMDVFEKECNKHGFYKIGMYANGYTLSSISKSLKKDGKDIEIKDTNWFVWKSGGTQYSTDEANHPGIELKDVKELKNQSNSQYTPVILQATNVCKDTGAINSRGHCDVNFCYSSEIFGTDFGKKTETVEYISIDLSQYRNINPSVIINTALNAIAAVGCAILGIEIIKNRIKIKFANSNTKDNKKVKVKR